MSEKKASRCTAIQANRRVPDFDCRIVTGAGQTHGKVHVDSRTGTHWGEGQKPRGWNSRWTGKRYGNPKLARRRR